MKKADDKTIWKLLQMCSLIKWKNISQEEYNKIRKDNKDNNGT